VRAQCDGERPISDRYTEAGRTCTFGPRDEDETPAAAVRRENEGLKSELFPLPEAVRSLISMPDVLTLSS